MQSRTNRSSLQLADVSRGAVLGALLLGLGSCGEHKQQGVPPAVSTITGSATASDAAAADSAAPGVPVKEPDYRAALRLERWAEAARLIDALDPSERAKPELRFVRARVAIALRQFDQVRPLLAGLDLPLLADDIERMKADAAVEVGPYEEAAAYLKAKGRPRDFVLAGRALAKAGDTKGALALADKAISEASRLKRPAEETSGHGLRADLTPDVDAALGDLVWLATHSPASTEGVTARKRLRDAKKALSAAQLTDCLDALLKAGAGKDAIGVLDKDGSILAKGTELRYRAEALFKSRDYTKAIDAYEKLEKTSSSGTGEEVFYQAKSLARVKREDEAITRYRDVIKRHKRGAWAERASFQIGQLYLLSGKYAEAEEAFKAYLADYGASSSGKGGNSKDEADYALALTYLSTNKPAKAKTIFARLADDAKKMDIGTLRELAGVAALRAGETNDATAYFTQVIKEQPLTWGALTARARLASMQAPLPAVIGETLAAAGAAAPLSPSNIVLPPKAKKFFELGLDADAEAALTENEQAAGTAYPNRESEALCAMYGSLSRAKRRYEVGARSVSFDALMRAPSAADRWAWECVYPAPYADAVTEYEKEYAVVPGLIHAIMRQESVFNPDALSPVGATGLMQLMPNTATEAAKEASVEFTMDLIRTPGINVRLGGYYLGKLSKTYAGALPLTIASYNAGPGAVSRWFETGKERDVDVWVARIPYDETRKYVGKVMSNLVRYQWLRGGSANVMELPITLPDEIHPGDNDY